MEKSYLNKTVWLFDIHGGWNYILNKTKTYKVVKVIPQKEVEHDWCDHLIVRDDCGNEQEIREFACIVVPDSTITDAVSRISRYLSDNHNYGEIINCIGDGRAVQIDVNWGDWKHDHGYLDNLMRYIGYRKVGETVTEENGSDTYSSIHSFVKEI